MLESLRACARGSAASRGQSACIDDVKAEVVRLGAHAASMLAAPRRMSARDVIVAIVHPDVREGGESSCHPVSLTYLEGRQTRLPHKVDTERTAMATKDQP